MHLALVDHACQKQRHLNPFHLPESKTRSTSPLFHKVPTFLIARISHYSSRVEDSLTLSPSEIRSIRIILADPEPPT